MIESFYWPMGWQAQLGEKRRRGNRADGLGGTMKKQELLDTINSLVIMFNHYADGKCEAKMGRDGSVHFFGKVKPEKPLTVRALVPTDALNDEHGRRSVLDYANAKYREANSEDIPATMRLKILNPELSEIIIKPLDIEIEYLEGDDD